MALLTMFKNWYMKNMSNHYVKFLFFAKSCTWNGADCDITEAFTTVITDLGVCYTFNAGDANKGRQTTEAGLYSEMMERCAMSRI